MAVIGRRSPRRVYPRVCGGTIPTGYDPEQEDGLSPRVRGNPRIGQSQPHQRRSIPACAGEPLRGGALVGMAGVYPRVCGGTFNRRLTFSTEPGLSPRVRGNRRGGQGELAPFRSIPACAGEPTRTDQVADKTAVYPRVCGGTLGESNETTKYTGLSPRVRGNPRLPGRQDRYAGSIPACAGNQLGMQAGNGRRRSIPACAGEPETSGKAR